MSHVLGFWKAILASYGLWACLERLYYTYTHPVTDDMLETMSECSSWDIVVFMEAADFDDF